MAAPLVVRAIDATKVGTPACSSRAGIVEAHADAHDQVRALRAAEEIARRELGAARRSARPCPGSSCGERRRRGRARVPPTRDPAERRLGNEHIGVGVRGVRHRHHRQPGDRQLAGPQVDLQHLAGVERVKLEAGHPLALHVARGLRGGQPIARGLDLLRAGAALGRAQRLEGGAGIGRPRQSWALASSSADRGVACAA